MSEVVVRPMREADLDQANRIFRLAFGTFVGLADPLRFAGDSDWVRPRWRAEPSAAFVAELDGAVVGSNLGSRWGSVAFFGPLSVRPDLWDRGIARRLLVPVLDCFERWGIRHAGLFTFAQSAKHVALYGKYGFHARFLTAVMARPIGPGGAAAWMPFSSVPHVARPACLADCRALTQTLFDGLDLGHEIEAVDTHRLGDTVLVAESGRLAGLAVCHVGAGTEAGSGTCFIKFGAVRPGEEASRDFERLLDACDAFAATRGATTVVAGVNLARTEAYQRMLARGFRTEIQGVSMHRPNEPAYSREDVFAIDDWR